MLSLLLYTATAHMHMTSPAAQFLPEFKSDANAPSQLCSLVSYFPGSNEILIPGFNKDLKTNGFNSLRDYADACAQLSKTKSCGNTVPLASVPFPADSQVNIDIYPISNHIGPSEIWVDDVLVMYNPGMIRSTVQKTPSSTRVDFGNVCPSGNCRVRFVMVALHNFPAEIFDNCVTVSGPSGPASKDVNQVQRTVVSNKVASQQKVPSQSQSLTKDAASTTNQEQQRNVNEATGGSEWSCSVDSTGLVRTVGKQRYEFTCALGTKCTTKHVPYAMCFAI